MEAIAKFKEAQKQMWSGFGALEPLTAQAAPRLVRFAGITRGKSVLDVGCGTGVVAITAARTGANVTAVDLTPTLVELAKENGALVHAEIEWREGDVEALPFRDEAFDVVVSQFGHMFAPRPDVAIHEMLRVLKPGGTLAFATWPPELYVGRMFSLLGKFSPPPPPGVASPPQWGDPTMVRERLGGMVKEIVFDRDVLRFPMLSPAHGLRFMEQHVGPVTRVVQSLQTDRAKLAQFRHEFEDLLSLYFEENFTRQDYLLTRAVKA